jgi:hypothetical protein
MTSHTWAKLACWWAAWGCLAGGLYLAAPK